MCGRTACTLDPQDVRRACTYTNRNGRRVRPRWRNPGRGGGGGGGSNTGNGQTRKQTDGGKQHSDENQNTQHKPKKYWPSFNMSPTQVFPVLVSSNHFSNQQKDGESEKTQAGERELCPMQWGLVPQWHKGNPSSVAYKMNNCRSEGMMEKVTFKRPFEKGRRCVVLADGFYEWKTDDKDKKSKQPYFIYFKQDKPVSDLRVDSDAMSEGPPEQDDMEEEEEMEGQDWNGHRLLTMAGLFDVWRPADGSEPLYTFTVITVESHPSFSWIHHRQPAVLDGEDAIRNWLDYGTVPHKQAMSLIKAVDSLAWHPVTTQVGNSRYKEADCVKPIELGKPVKSSSSNLMSSWLKKGNKTTPPSIQESDKDEKRGTKRSQPSPTKPNPMMAWLKKANSDEKLQKVTGGPPTPKKIKKSLKQSGQYVNIH